MTTDNFFITRKPHNQFLSTIVDYNFHIDVPKSHLSLKPEFIIPFPRITFGYFFDHPFTVKVKGSIEDFKFQNYKLMPMGNGQLILPAKAAIRKKIGKEAGDWVNVVLFADLALTEIPKELLDCLKEEPIAYKAFLNYIEGQKKEFIDWIYTAKTDHKKVERIAETLNKLVKGQKLRDK